ncbi:MAG TPA: DUF3054 domain-containing protein [Streptosporangiaceae bacterium]|nr:DUF3054 domain-containing protein [Streptosporangiaceae bacterium]
MRKAASAGADFCCVLVFVAIGRANHHDGGGLAGFWDTLWPFAAGLVIGLLVTRFWRRPTALLPTGVGVWLSTVAAGMILRVLAGQGTALAFILVTLVFLGLFQLGWRLAWRWLDPARRRLAVGGAAGDGTGTR